LTLGVVVLEGRLNILERTILMNGIKRTERTWRPPVSRPNRWEKDEGPDIGAGVPDASRFQRMRTAVPRKIDEAFSSVEEGVESYRRGGYRPLPDDDFRHTHRHGDGAEVEPGERGAYARFQVVFEWLLDQIVSRLVALDEAVGGRGDYEAARANYTGFLEALERRDREVYGNLIKTVLKIEPTIRRGRMEGVTVEVEWNPHSSSSMIHT
jgi:hypothetical protein